MMWWRRKLSVRTRLTLWYTGILLSIVLMMSALSYYLLRWSMMQDLDASLLTVAQVMRDTSPATLRSGESAPEAAARDILGPEFHDKFFRLLDPYGRLSLRSSHRHADILPLSPEARRNAARGVQTFETIRLGQDPVRLLTMPITRGGELAQFVQVGISLHRTQQALGRFLDTLLLVIPLGVGLAAIGGTAIARKALRPVDEMSRTARRITAEDLSRRIQRRGTSDELDRLADTLNAMLERLEAAFAQMRRFAADAAHELRTPLTVLKGGIEVSLRAERSSAEYQSVLASSLEEVERLIRLAEDLLILSRASAGLDGPRVRVDLEPVLLEVLDLGVQLARGTGVTIRVKEAMPATAIGDVGALRRAVLNLVENAVKYTPAGGTVELSLVRVDNWAELVVKDSGPGIDSADAERVFEPFVRLDAARQRATGGSGLGLSIARSIVLAHGGTLSLDSTPGVGSRFAIRLPLA